jgi:hypothetical protein
MSAIQSEKHPVAASVGCRGSNGVRVVFALLVACFGGLAFYRRGISTRR